VRTILKTSTLALVAALLLSTAPASAATLNLGGAGNGGVVNFSGSNTDPNVDVLTNGTVNNGSPNGTATSNALNNGGGPTTASLGLGGTGGTGDADGSVLLDLFGAGDGNDAAVALGSGNGTDGGAALDLFGNGGGGGSGAGGAGSGGDLFGPSGSGNGGTGNGVTANGIRVASLDNSANTRCFAPDPTQIARLTNRHDYSEATLSSWVNASSITIIKTNLCDAARTSIVRDGNVARLQAFVNGNPVLKSFLAKQGQSANDVIAIDKKGDTLTVYVS